MRNELSLCSQLRHASGGDLKRGGCSLTPHLNNICERDSSAYSSRIFRMPRPTTRTEVLGRLKGTIASGKIILGAGAGLFTSFDCGASILS